MARRLLRVKWNGTSEEMFRLIASIGHACDQGTEPCRRNGDHTPLTCSAHMLLYTDQRTLDDLLFGLRIAHRLRAEEWRSHTQQS